MKVGIRVTVETRRTLGTLLGDQSEAGAGARGGGGTAVASGTVRYLGHVSRLSPAQPNGVYVGVELDDTSSYYPGINHNGSSGNWSGNALTDNNSSQRSYPLNLTLLVHFATFIPATACTKLTNNALKQQLIACSTRKF